MNHPIRVLLAKPTHDCHDRGVRYVARKFRDAGFEVIFANFLLPTAFGIVTRGGLFDDCLDVVLGLIAQDCADSVARFVSGDFGGIDPATVDECVEIVAGLNHRIHMFRV